jgi:hypothetical protein
MNIDQRKAFYASVRAIEALCPACKQPQNAPSCERREHWLPEDLQHDPFDDENSPEAQSEN